MTTDTHANVDAFRAAFAVVAFEEFEFAHARAVLFHCSVYVEVENVYDFVDDFLAAQSWVDRKTLNYSIMIIRIITLV